MTMKKAQKERKTEVKKSKDLTEYTKYEKARMIGSRALQISMGAHFLVKLSSEDLEKIKYDPIKIAIMEFDAGILPITVKKPGVKG